MSKIPLFIFVLLTATQAKSQTDTLSIWNELHPAFHNCYRKVVNEIISKSDPNIESNNTLDSARQIVHFDVYILGTSLPTDSAQFLKMLLPAFDSKAKFRLFRIQNRTSKEKKDKFCNCFVNIYLEDEFIYSLSMKRLQKKKIKRIDNLLLTNELKMTPENYSHMGVSWPIADKGHLHFVLLLGSGWKYFFLINPSLQIYYNSREGQDSKYILISYKTFLEQALSENVITPLTDFSNPDVRTYKITHY
jgi:hypothetical protein